MADDDSSSMAGCGERGAGDMRAAYANVALLPDVFRRRREYISVVNARLRASPPITTYHCTLGDGHVVDGEQRGAGRTLRRYAWWRCGSQAATLSAGRPWRLSFCAKRRRHETSAA